MLQHESRVLVVDNSGAKLVMVIQKLVGSNKKHVYVGDTAITVVKVSDLTRRKTFRSALHRALLVRTKNFTPRSIGFRVKFDESSVILVNKKNLPLGSRLKGPVVQELCERFPFIGTLSEVIL